MRTGPDALLDGLVGSGALTVAEVRSWLERQVDAGLTLRDAVPRILARWAEHPQHRRAVKQYRPSVRRLVDGEPEDPELGLTAVPGLGDHPIDMINLRTLEIHASQIRTYRGEAKVRRAKRDHRPLYSYDPRSHGGGVEQNLIELIRKLFATATEVRLVASNPALGLRRAHQDPDTTKTYRRAGQLQDVFNLVMYTGDWELDQRLLDISCVTGWRGRTCLVLRLHQIDIDNGCIHVTEKNDKTRDIPVSIPRLVDLKAFARSRGAVNPDDLVFRRTDGVPITHKHLESLYARVHTHCAWADGHQYGFRWHRHLLAQAVARVGGWGCAVTLLGHSVTATGATHRYVPEPAPYADVVAALEQVFGPMASTQPFWAVQEPDFTGLFPPSDEQE